MELTFKLIDSSDIFCCDQKYLMDFCARGVRNIFPELEEAKEFNAKISFKPLKKSGEKKIRFVYPTSGKNNDIFGYCPYVKVDKKEFQILFSTMDEIMKLFNKKTSFTLYVSIIEIDGAK